MADLSESFKSSHQYLVFYVLKISWNIWKLLTDFKKWSDIRINFCWESGIKKILRSLFWHKLIGKHISHEGCWWGTPATETLWEGEKYFVLHPHSGDPPPPLSLPLLLPHPLLSLLSFSSSFFSSIFLNFI